MPEVAPAVAPTWNDLLTSSQIIGGLAGGMFVLDISGFDSTPLPVAARSSPYITASVSTAGLTY